MVNLSTKFKSYDQENGSQTTTPTRIMPTTITTTIHVYFDIRQMSQKGELPTMISPLYR